MALPCDPVTFEIIRHKLNAVIDEATIALENVSGSPITNEGHDMMVSLYTSDGGLMVGGVGYLYHLTSASQAVKHILATYADDPGIAADDVFLLNDPYTAALHPPDMYVISPIHWEEELVGFVANFVHLTDIGAISPGGFCPDAVDSFQEGFITKGLKLVDGGRPRRDVFETILSNVRDPDITGLDLRSQLAANHTAKQRMFDLYRTHGSDLIEAVSRTLIDMSEAGIKRRLSELPDGTWKARQYLDLPDGIKRLELACTKRGASIAFDFEGTDSQSEVGVNATYWGAIGGVFGAVFPLLAWDLTWNDGVIGAVEVSAPSGSLANCQHPAPISIATIGVIKVISSLATNVISKMFGTSEIYRDRVTATWKGSHMNLEVFGRSEDGSYFVTLLTDSFAGSGGARSNSDGVDLGGEISNQVGRWANAESQETRTPIVHLFREPLLDSGGPGRFRGGVSHTVALTPHQAKGDSIEIATFALGVVSSFSQGIAGGYSGSHVNYTIHRGAINGSWVSNVDELDEGEPALWGHFEIGEGDVLRIQGSGGGGFGDPIERDPELVLNDVRNRIVSEKSAYETYGVGFSGRRTVDIDETTRRRFEIRGERLGYTPPHEPSFDRIAGSRKTMISDYVFGSSDGHECARCGTILASGEEHWKDGAISADPITGWLGPLRPLAPSLALYEFYCPGCGTLLDSEVLRDGDDLLRDSVSFDE